VVLLFARFLRREPRRLVSDAHGKKEDDVDGATNKQTAAAAAAAGETEDIFIIFGPCSLDRIRS
jgi:hypothetical protein